METHQKDIEEKDPFGQNRAEAGNEKSFLKALLAERALKKIVGNTGNYGIATHIAHAHVSAIFPKFSFIFEFIEEPFVVCKIQKTKAAGTILKQS